LRVGKGLGPVCHAGTPAQDNTPARGPSTPRAFGRPARQFGQPLAQLRQVVPFVDAVRPGGTLLGLDEPLQDAPLTVRVLKGSEASPAARATR